MKIDILTLFPKMFEGFLNESIIKRAIDKKLVKISVHDIRDYSRDPHKRVDDYPFGGGKGMVLKCEPIYDALDDLKSDISKVIMMTPQGKPFKQEMAKSYSKEAHLIFLCGHYEGFDERISQFVDEEVSIGDFIVTGGELPSMMITDAIVRLIEGVIEEESHQNESFEDNLLDYPTYTKPRDFKGHKVPDVLLSGDHKKIAEFRREEQIKKTKERRPDLIQDDDEEGSVRSNAIKSHERVERVLTKKEVSEDEKQEVKNKVRYIILDKKDLQNLNKKVDYEQEERDRQIAKEIDLEKLRKLEELKQKLLTEKQDEPNLEMEKERSIRSR